MALGNKTDRTRFGTCWLWRAIALQKTEDRRQIGRRNSGGKPFADLAPTWERGFNGDVFVRMGIRRFESRAAFVSFRRDGCRLLKFHAPQGFWPLERGVRRGCVLLLWEQQIVHSRIVTQSNRVSEHMYNRYSSRTRALGEKQSAAWHWLCKAVRPGGRMAKKDNVKLPETGMGYVSW